MKIRTRLTLWYCLILGASLLAIGIGTYYELSEQLRDRKRGKTPDNPTIETEELMMQVGIPAVLIGALGGWWLARKTLNPIVTLTKAVEGLNDENLQNRLPTTGNGDELDRLTTVYNEMTMRLDASFMRIREFTLHASHELKTPLTVMRGELETALSDASLNAGQKELFEGQIEEIERLAKIVDGLTLLTKADSGEVRLENARINFEELVRESFADAKMLSQPSGIQLTMSHCEPVLVEGDRHRLRQLLLNLTDNAIKYNQSSGSIEFSLRREGRTAVFQISNTGAGLAAEFQPRVFERFFRGDQSHGRYPDGCGLGLSIAQWIVHAHKGEIRFVSEMGKSTTVTVRLPVPEIA